MRHGGSVTVAAGQPGRRNTLRYSALRGLRGLRSGRPFDPALQQLA
jgi:hypothetical protein